MSRHEHAGKRKYETQEEADRACTMVWAKDPTINIGDLHSYKCPKCHYYHIGHKKWYRGKKP